ncbi:MAG: hydantoinase/oxoprolinase family protein [Alphaproteobacteria bacterium]|nr:hydantoinase/oxoprolinase family protein [Alphaproteobacteria bacterium]
MGERARYIVASDVGGTCTDTVVFAAGEPIHLGKALSTPPHFADGVLDSLDVAARAMGLACTALLVETALFVHGSTVVDNAILTRSGARTGLLTTEGFEDTLLITRGAYGRWSGLSEDRIKHPVKTDRATPLVDPAAIKGVAERVDYKGAVLRELEETSAEEAIRFLIEERGVEALAVSLLWSFYNPVHERKLRALIERVAPGVYVTLSSEVAPVPGEYERSSTTVINAYAGAISRDYLQSLESKLGAAGYRGPVMVMQGYGGLLPAREAANLAVGMIESGPAAGVIGARYLGRLMRDADIIACDMGGTTFKVGVIQGGAFGYAREPLVDRYHYAAPKIEVVSIGAGGGSIVALDPETKVPRVGPQSAGASPGPVCYGRGGTEPTLTDVMTLIGYMDADHFLDGSIKLDLSAARRVFDEKIARPLGRSVEAAAFGIYRIAAAQITDLIHEITVERGLDPRDFVLHSFGGTCALLSATFGRELNVRKVIVPYTASVHCAFGLVSADIVHEYTHAAVLPVPSPPEAVNDLFAPMVERALGTLHREGFAGDRLSLDWSIDLRYSRQVHEVTTTVRAETPLDASGLVRLVDDFEALYERKYGAGSAYREAGIEMTLFRLTARGLMARPTIEPASLNSPDSSGARIGRRAVYSEAKDAMAPADIYDFTRLVPGNLVAGPAVIHTPITTIVVPDAQTARMDALRNIVIELG